MNRLVLKHAEDGRKTIATFYVTLGTDDDDAPNGLTGSDISDDDVANEIIDNIRQLMEENKS